LIRDAVRDGPIDLLSWPNVSRDHWSNDVVAPALGDVDSYGFSGGTIVVPAGATLTSNFDRNRALYGDGPAYRFIDYSQAQDGRVIELSWKELWSRVCAIGARLQQITAPEDRVAILAP
jgi:hypothetical protein